jgi:hypothetical protein
MEGFNLALKSGLSCFNGLASVLVRVGDQFVQGSGSVKPSPYLLHPMVAGRLLRALARCLLDGRRRLLPKDLWDVKCIGVGGTDTRLFKNRIKEYWGRAPAENYACTEAGFLASQLWNGQGMTFYPDVNFLEFLPEAQLAAGDTEASQRMKTLLLDEVQAGGRYELVVTNFRGGAMVRYRTGDIVEIVALRDEELNVNLPQMMFYSRLNDMIDIGGMVRLTESTIWQAIADSGFAYSDWVARKEYVDSHVVLRVYVEPKGEILVGELRERIRANLLRLNQDYADMERNWQLDPLDVRLLPIGAYKHFYETRQREGADLAHLKPPHMSPSDRALQLLMEAT